MRHFLISALLLSLVAGCSSVNIGPHRIDVQQGNALDQENVARLKTGLNRSQVRFLLGTPLLVDPFRGDRWDYVYVNYKAGKLAEQKRITLFFDGETLVRIEGDLPESAPPAPAPAPAIQPESISKTTLAPAAAMAPPAPEPLAPHSDAPQAASPNSLAASVVSSPELAATSQAAGATPTPTPTPAVPEPVAASVGAASAVAATAPSSPADVAPLTETSIVAPLPSPKNAPVYVDLRPSAELSLQPVTDVEAIKPDVIPSFPDPAPANATNDAPVLTALNVWANAWSRRDEDAYIAAYDTGFMPQGGGSREEWEKRRRLLLNVAKNIELKISGPAVDWAGDGSVTVSFNQFYRSDTYRDAVTKQLRMVERDGRWLIVEEKVLSTLRGARP